MSRQSMLLHVVVIVVNFAVGVRRDGSMKFDDDDDDNKHHTDPQMSHEYAPSCLMIGTFFALAYAAGGPEWALLCVVWR